jgi:hypothetical protein
MSKTKMYVYSLKAPFLNEDFNHCKIIVTVGEQTSVNIQFWADYVLNPDVKAVVDVEFSDIGDKIYSGAWLRENVLFDVPKDNDRVIISDAIKEIVQCVVEDVDYVIQSIHDGEGSKIIAVSEYMRAGAEKMTLKEIDYPKIEGPSVDVSHITGNKDFFHRFKLNENLFKTNFWGEETHTFFLGHDNGVDTLTDELFEPYSSTIVAIHPSVPVNCILLDTLTRNFRRIDMIVCDTMVMKVHDALPLLSWAKAHDILCVRAIHLPHVGVNFGVPVKEGKLYNSWKGYIDLGVLDPSKLDYTAYIALDPRMPQFKDMILLLNDYRHVATIAVNHELADYCVKHLDNYKLYPSFHTMQFSAVEQLLRNRKISTPLAFRLSFPNIANMMFNVGCFVSSDMEKVEAYTTAVVKEFKKLSLIRDSDELELLGYYFGNMVLSQLK